MCDITITHLGYLFVQLRLLWHLLLHSCLELKYLQQVFWYFLRPLHELLTKPCLPLIDSLVMAHRREISISLLMSPSRSSLSGPMSN